MCFSKSLGCVCYHIRQYKLFNKTLKNMNKKRKYYPLQLINAYELPNLIRKVLIMEIISKIF